MEPRNYIRAQNDQMEPIHSIKGLEVPNGIQKFYKGPKMTKWNPYIL